MSKAKRWCYTLNNPTAPLNLDATYHIYGDEVGESGTHHYQGFVIFKTQKRLTALKKLSPNAHWETTRGTNIQASEYCKKDGKFVETGELPKEKHILGGEATKRKYEEAFAQAKLGNLDEISADLRVKHYRTFKEIQKDYMLHLPPLDDTCGTWYYGHSGVGKSRRARDEHPSAYLKQSNKWWDGYQQEDAVIIDDFDKSHACLGHYLKIWADHYEFMGETKGGQIKLRPKHIIVTSQYQIEDVWDDVETVDALNRRFRQIKIIS
nr:MAG: replication associated protein [Cressdnaviricota sp.]